MFKCMQFPLNIPKYPTPHCIWMQYVAEEMKFHISHCCIECCLFSKSRCSLRLPLAFQNTPGSQSPREEETFSKYVANLPRGKKRREQKREVCVRVCVCFQRSTKGATVRLWDIRWKTSNNVMMGPTVTLFVLSISGLRDSSVCPHTRTHIFACVSVCVSISAESVRMGFPQELSDIASLYLVYITWICR